MLTILSFYSRDNLIYVLFTSIKWCIIVFDDLDVFSYGFECHPFMILVLFTPLLAFFMNWKVIMPLSFAFLSLFGYGSTIVLLNLARECFMLLLTISLAFLLYVIINDLVYYLGIQWPWWFWVSWLFYSINLGLRFWKGQEKIFFFY